MFIAKAAGPGTRGGVKGEGEGWRVEGEGVEGQRHSILILSVVVETMYMSFWFLLSKDCRHNKLHHKGMEH